MLPFSYALRNLGRRGMRTVLTLVGLALITVLVILTDGFARGLAREFGDYGITVNCVGPGSIHRGERAEHESVKDILPGQPVRRKGRADEVTSLLVYLASQNAGFITGQCYLANGGAYFQ